MNKNTLLSQTKCLIFSKIGVGAIGALSLMAMPMMVHAASYNGPRITFDQIYAQPGNQELNLNYARQQAADGDYISAASTLERLLFAQPDWDSARLFYAFVLFRLDDKMGAEQQLKLLDARPLSADQRNQVAQYRGEADGTRSAGSNSDTSFSGRVAIGVKWDDNAGSALSDNLLIVTNQDDLSAFLQGSLNFSAPIDNGIRFRAGVNGQSLRHDTFSGSDYDTIVGYAGIGGKSNTVHWSVDAQLLEVFISGGDYLTQIGPRASIGTDIAPGTRITLSGAYYDQNYSDLSFTVGETARSGDKYIIRASIRNKVSDQTTIGATVGYDRKTAANAGFAYDGFRASANFRSKFANGVYVKGRARYRMLDYDLFAPGAVQRKDDHISGRVSVGTSLSNYGAENMSIEGGLSYVNRNSNIAGLDYENVGAELKLIYDF